MVHGCCHAAAGSLRPDVDVDVIAVDFLNIDVAGAFGCGAVRVDVLESVRPGLVDGPGIDNVTDMVVDGKAQLNIIVIRLFLAVGADEIVVAVDLEYIECRIRGKIVAFQIGHGAGNALYEGAVHLEASEGSAVDIYGACGAGSFGVHHKALLDVHSRIGLYRGLGVLEIRETGSADVAHPVSER